jgi:hypothetical protein
VFLVVLPTGAQPLQSVLAGSLKKKQAGKAGRSRLTWQAARERTKQCNARVRLLDARELASCQHSLILGGCTKKLKGNDGQELSAELDVITTELSENDRSTEQTKRATMLDALTRYATSRYDFGRALAAYKRALQVERVWMSASKAIAKHMGRSQRTVFRILEDYERVAGAPKPVIAAMRKEGFDPAELKNARLLGQVVDMTQAESTPEQTQEVVRKTAALLKQNKGQQTMSEDDQIVWGIRQDIRKRLNNVPDDHKWDLLERAIAEEASEVWGVTEPWQVNFTPRPGPKTVDGRTRQKQQKAAA